MKSFFEKNLFYNMMKQNTCLKDDGGSCIDLLITNSKFSVMKANSFETGLSEYHHMIHTILKTKFEKFNQKNQYTAISNNMIVTNLNWIFLIVCLL